MSKSWIFAAIPILIAVGPKAWAEESCPRYFGDDRAGHEQIAECIFHRSVNALHSGPEASRRLREQMHAEVEQILSELPSEFVDEFRRMKRDVGPAYDKKCADFAQNYSEDDAALEQCNMMVGLGAWLFVYESWSGQNDLLSGMMRE